MGKYMFMEIDAFAGIRRLIYDENISYFIGAEAST